MIVPDRTWLAQHWFAGLSRLAALPAWPSAVRVRLLRLAGLTIGDRTSVLRDVRIRNPRVVVGAGCVLEQGVRIEGLAEVRILDGTRVPAGSVVDTADGAARGDVVIHRPVVMGGA